MRRIRAPRARALVHVVCLYMLCSRCVRSTLSRGVGDRLPLQNGGLQMALRTADDGANSRTASVCARRSRNLSLFRLVFSLLVYCAMFASAPAYSWALTHIAKLPPGVGDNLPTTAGYLPGRDLRIFFELKPTVRDRESLDQILVLQRDRGNRLWLLNSKGTILQEMPLGGASVDSRVGIRGLAFALDNAGPNEAPRYLAIDSVLGIHPHVRVESIEHFYDRERAIWIYEISLSAALVMLVALTMALSLILRERVYFAYISYLIMMLASIALRHPIAFRSAADFGLSPERVAALGVLVSTIAVLATITLLREASGIASRHPRASRWMQIISISTIVLACVNLTLILSNFRAAQWAFAWINLLFGAIAILSAALLISTAWSGGRSARIFLLGWVPMVLVGAWFSIGSLVGIPQTQSPHRWVMFACVLQGIGWAVALGDRALSMQRERDRAWALAEVDELTGLPNRRMLDRELQNARNGWVLIFDLDSFKAVNDRFGHAIGDSCLVHFAQCMREALAGDAVFGRYGGEEFVAIVPQGDREHVVLLAERLRERTLSTPVHAGDSMHRLTVSAGIAALDGTDGRTALSAADRALYRAKSAGRNRIELAT